MPRICKIALILLPAIASLSQRTVAQQAKPPAQAARDKIRVQTNLVVLSVTVKDSRGNLVSGLAQQDFHIFEDSVEQQPTLFSSEGLPLSLIILVDSDMKWKQGSAMTKSLRAVAGGLSDTDEAMVCRYDMLFYPGDAFTNAAGTLMAALKSAAAAAEPSPEYIPQPVKPTSNSTSGPPSIAAPTNLGSRPSKALDDALFSAAGLLEQRPLDRRRVILLISDGVNEPKLNHHGHQQVLDLLLQKNISVYSLAVGAEHAKHKFSDLIDYSSQTGGDIFYATQTAAMETLYSRITEQARHDYILAYTPPLTSSSDSHFRSIKVTLTTPGLTASTRSGYFTTLPDNSTQTPQP
jgi:VWFA-related protein